VSTIVVHPERCVGCRQCEVACAVAHSSSKNLFTAVFETPRPRPRIHAEPGPAMNTSFPNTCRQCNPAPCHVACPSGAIRRADDISEALLRDARRCIACGMCAMVCPFGVITFHADLSAPERPAVATKCDLCIGRLREEAQPACVDACKAGALEFGDVNQLLREVRRRQSEMASVEAARVVAEATAVPPHIEAWRAWGSAVARLNQTIARRG
jgi:carbon-monoxide dehydrogenase iron sulfur subunit